MTLDQLEINKSILKGKLGTLISKWLASNIVPEADSFLLIKDLYYLYLKDPEALEISKDLCIKFPSFSKYVRKYLTTSFPHPVTFRRTGKGIAIEGIFLKISTCRTMSNMSNF